MRKISADWVFPVSSAPVFMGVLVLDRQDRIIEVLDPDRVVVDYSDVERYDGILCPGFVNTHCHLELSYLQGRIDRHTGLDRFIRQIRLLYREEAPSSRPEQAFYLESAMQQLGESGTVALGDIVSFLPSAEHMEIKEGGAFYIHSFAEVFGSSSSEYSRHFREGMAVLDRLRSITPHKGKASLAAHAPYSLSPELLQLVMSHIETEGLPTTMHHLENEDEAAYFTDGSGPVRKRMEDWGIVMTAEPLRGDRPLIALHPYLPREAPLLLVHNTAALPVDIVAAGLIQENIYWCFCPNANLFIENRLPDPDVFAGLHHRITLGTDGLVSNTSLSVLEEMKTLQQHFPALELETLIRWGTLNGAAFLGIDDWAGSFEKGKKPGINLIRHADLEKLTLNKESRVSPLTRYPLF